MITVQNLVSDVYKTLSSFNIKNDTEKKRYIITGTLSFKETYKSHEIEDCFDISVWWPYNFPKDLPKIFECGGRIPHDADFHVNVSDNNSLCLATRRSEKEILIKNPTFENYIIKLVIPFLYAFAYKTQKGCYPWGEEKHADKGLLEDYRTFFNLPDTKITEKFLLQLALHKNMKGHHLCPCGSGKKFRYCHAPLYWEIMEYYNYKNLLEDCLLISPEEIKQNKRLENLCKKYFKK